jgi:hypothetical protein
LLIVRGIAYVDHASYEQQRVASICKRRGGVIGWLEQRRARDAESLSAA